MSMLSSPSVLRRLLILSILTNILFGLYSLREPKPWEPSNVWELETTVSRDSSRPSAAEDDRIVWNREPATHTPGKVSVLGPFSDAAFELYAGLYAQHAEELHYIRARAREFCQSLGTGSDKVKRCLSQDIEMEVSYLRLRHMKPKSVWEIGPSHGFSTIWLLHALKMNNNEAVLHSFDPLNLAEGLIPAEFKEPKGPKWKFHLGKVAEIYRPILNGGNGSTPDYLYLDAFHSRESALFYANLMTEVVAVRTQKGMRGRVGVSVHDAYHPYFWTDRYDGRNLRIYPRWMPNEEAILLLDHIAYQLPSAQRLRPDEYGRYPPSHSYCNLHTFASSRVPRTFIRFLAMRDKVLAAHNGHASEDNAFVSDKFGEWRGGIPTQPVGFIAKDQEPPSLQWTQLNPTIYFEIGCRIKVMTLRDEMIDDGLDVEDDPEEEDCCSCAAVKSGEKFGADGKKQHSCDASGASIEAKVDKNVKLAAKEEEKADGKV